MDPLLVTVVGTLIGTLLALEAKEWIPLASVRLLRATLARLPKELDEALRKRWTEEIEADLASYDGRPVGGLMFAVRVRMKGARDLAAELALQQALNSSVGEQDEASDAETQAPRAQPALELNFDAPLSLIERLLLNALREVAVKAPSARQGQLDELRVSLSHPMVRKTFCRLRPPDIGSEEGIKVALILRELREEVEGWDNRE